MDEEMSVEELEKVIQFQEVTGIEDISLARIELMQCNWNVETAVQTHLSLRGSPQRNSNIRHRSHSLPTNENLATEDNTAQPANRTAVVQSYSSWLLSIPSSLVMGIFRWCVYVISLPMRIFLPYPRRLYDPLEDVMSFITGYESDYGTQHPVFCQGSYSQALNEAKTHLKFLIVYLHCADNQDTPKFCKEVLPNARVIEYLNRNVIFWGCSVTSAEGYKVSQAVRENAYPFLAVIVLKDTKMTLVGRLEGPQEPDTLISRIEAVMRESEAHLVVARADRHEREINAALRQEQDAAYMESLKADREKAKKRQEEIDAQNDRERQEKEKEQNILDEKEKRKRLKIEWADRIPEEPSQGCSTLAEIVAKLPEGTRLNRRFSSQHSLSALYYYIFCHPDAPDRFQITTNFPRKVVPCEPTDEVPVPPTFEEFGIAQKTMLFIIDLDA